jgi:PAS domain S-box-containing protein
MEAEIKSTEELRAENEELRARLGEAEETLRALRSGEVDVLVVGDKLYALEGVDAESNRFRGEIIAQIYDAVIAVDNDGRVIYLNPAAERQYEVTASEVLGRNVEQVRRVRWPRPDDEAAMQRALLETGHWFGEEIHVKHTGAELQVESTVGRLLDSSGSVIGLLAAIRDVTPRKRLESQLAAARTELERHAANLESLVAQRTAKLNETVEELEAFSFTIAHDMRAPLRAMQGFSQILEEEYSGVLDGTANNYLERIRVSANRLDQLIHDVLHYSRIVRGDLVLSAVDSERLLSEIVASYPNLQHPDVTIEIEGPLPVVQANPAALTQVFSNLLGNAVKFVKPGVNPRVKVRAEAAADAGMVRFWIEDNGIGIDPESRARIFGMFQRLNRPGLYEGTGMGLTIVRKALERMGGRIDVQSEPGHGSRFWVELQRT